MLRDAEFYWQAAEWLIAASVPAALAVDALRSATWDGDRALRIVGVGILVWVWGYPFATLIRGSSSTTAWLHMAMFYAPLSVIAFACLVMGVQMTRPRTS